MAPASQAPPKRAIYDGSRPRFRSLEDWLNVYGNAEYAIYKRDAAPNPLSYEDWAASEHVLGPFLFYTTLDVWEQSSSSDEESDNDESHETKAFPSRALPERPLKKATSVNGHAKRAATTTKSSPSIPLSKPQDPTSSAKRKRKVKKPYLSEDIVVSDVSDDNAESAPAVEDLPSTLTVPTSPTTGRRKSGGRKKKQYLSAEIISPEDEEEDPMSMNGVVDNAACVQKSSAPAENRPMSIAMATSGPLPKGKRGRKPKRKSLSQAIVSRDDDDHGDAPADVAPTPKNAAASPETPGSSSSRRGLRIRTPAQQRPYFHNAQAFEELVSNGSEADFESRPSPPRPKMKLKLTHMAQTSYPGQSGSEKKVQDESIVEGNPEDEEMLEPEGSLLPRKAHYKGKGRAWKKTSEDEDGDYKSPIKTKTPDQPKRQLGKRRSGATSEAVAQALEIEGPGEQPHHAETESERPVSQSLSPLRKQKQRKPRKSHQLSEEFVRDDSDTAPEERQGPQQAEPLVSASPAQQKTPKARGRGRPRKSDQNSAPKDVVNSPADGATSATSKKKSPPKKRTPKKSAEYVTLTDDSVDDKMDGLEAIPSEDERQKAEPEPEPEPAPKPPEVLKPELPHLPVESA